MSARKRKSKLAIGVMGQVKAVGYDFKTSKATGELYATLEVKLDKVSKHDREAVELRLKELRVQLLGKRVQMFVVS